MITLMLFVSDYCPGCHPMEVKCQQIVNDSEDVKLEIYNVDEDDEALQLAKAFYIMSTPTLLIKQDDKIIDQIVGNVGISTIESVLEAL
jgi:thiol-disulfide isomerase/thioredoxin